MIDYSFFFINTVLVMGCITLAIVFLTLPFPNEKELHNYRISLYFLAGAYLFFAALKSFGMFYNINIVNIMPAIPLIVSSLQATLFSLSLINLINPLRINKRFVILNILPILVFILIFVTVWTKYGNPSITTFEELRLLILHPTVIIRILLTLYYITQLIFLTHLFFKELKAYNQKLDKYCSDNYKLSLRSVKNSFIAALIIGLVAMGSAFTSDQYITFGITLLYALFYTIFGIFYIQYPVTYKLIKPVLVDTSTSTTENQISYKHNSWVTLKEIIIKEKYYLVYGISIVDIAQNLRISRTTLSNLINQNENKNFNAWINCLRIEEAKKLLIDFPDYSLIQIAELTGYSELSNFSKQFKLITNESPSIWRKTKFS